MQISYTVRLFAICALLLAVAFKPVQAEESKPENLQPLISFDVKNESLRNILQKISAETGYRIEVNKELLDTKVSGSFHNTTLTALMSRILKESNVFIIEDSSDRFLSVRSVASAANEEIEVFQDEEPSGNLVIEVKLAQASLDKSIMDNQDTIESSPGISYRSFIESRNELDQYLIDNATQITATSGQSYAQLKEAQDQLDQLIVNDSTVEASENTPYSDLKEEQKSLDAKILSDETVEASPGMSYQELIKIQAQLDKQLATGKK